MSGKPNTFHLSKRDFPVKQKAAINCVLETDPNTEKEPVPEKIPPSTILY